MVAATRLLTRRSSCSPAGAPALVAVASEEPLGVITKLDLLEYLARSGRRS